MNGTMKRFLLGMLAAVILLPAVGAPPAAAEVGVVTESVCFTVHLPGDPVDRQVLGTRYRAGAMAPGRTALVLVHGTSTRDLWDLNEDFSVGRRLARAGYVVIAYDQLGFGESRYDGPGGGRAITLQGSREMLHEVVGAVKAGSYATDGNCSGAGGGMAGIGAGRVVLVGHSGGGAIVSGYAGLYRDVAAVVQAAWSNQGMNPELFLPGTAGWNMTRQLATGKEYLVAFLDDHGRFNREQCETFSSHLPGIEPEVSFCREPQIRSIGAPAGWLATVTSLTAENVTLTRQVASSVPVLLAWPEHDRLFPVEYREAENRHWRRHCGCDVTTWTQPDAGHGFQAHRSMPSFTDKVVSWLASKGLDAERS